MLGQQSIIQAAGIPTVGPYSLGEKQRVAINDFITRTKSPPAPLPLWAKRLIGGRDHYDLLAIARMDRLGDAGMPTECFVLWVACKHPVYGHFQRCSLEDGGVVLDAVELDADTIGLSYYSLKNYLDSSEVDALMGDGDDDFEICVLNPLGCRGEYIVANMRPIWMEMFLAGLPATTGQETEPKEKKISQRADVVQKLIEEFPFLRLADFSINNIPKKAPEGDAPPVEPRDNDDDDYASDDGSDEGSVEEVIDGYTRILLALEMI